MKQFSKCSLKKEVARFIVNESGTISLIKEIVLTKLRGNNKILFSDNSHKRECNVHFTGNGVNAL